MSNEATVASRTFFLVVELLAALVSLGDQAVLAQENVTVRVSIIAESDGSGDPRQTYRQYAETTGLRIEEVYEKFSANGRLYCGRDKENGTWLMGSAAIVGKATVAISAAHSFYGENCMPIEEFSKCFFQSIVKPADRPRRYYVKSVNVGNMCPEQNRRGDDWAVIELEKPVLNAMPYKLTGDCTLDERWSGINVAAAHNNFEVSSRHPPAIATCKARGADPMQGTIKTDCPAGAWASGSGLLCDVRRVGGTPAIAGILVTGQPNTYFDFKPYDPDFNFTQVVPISGNFLSTLQRRLQD